MVWRRELKMAWCRELKMVWRRELKMASRSDSWMYWAAIQAWFAPPVG
jgi:hypothetical protein